VPTLSADDTDAAIQIIETNLLELDARLREKPVSVLASRRAALSILNSPTAVSNKMATGVTTDTVTSKKHHLLLPTYLDLVAQETRNITQSKNNTMDQNTTVIPNVTKMNRIGAAHIVQYQTPRVHRKASYEDGRSPSLKRARNVTLGQSPRRRGAGAIEYLEEIHEQQDARPLSRPLILATTLPFETKQEIMDEWEREEHALEFVSEVVVPLEINYTGNNAVDHHEVATIDTVKRSSMVSPPLSTLHETESKNGNASPKDHHHHHHYQNNKKKDDNSSSSSNNSSSSSSSSNSSNNPSTNTKSNNSIHRKPKGKHRRLPHASLDALSSGDNVFNRVAGKYSRR
tara:strand:+ start:700 stop:1731 length:1032 start_codon:yes stop_codon:yes gene_type:complete